MFFLSFDSLFKGGLTSSYFKPVGKELDKELLKLYKNRAISLFLMIGNVIFVVRDDFFGIKFIYFI